MATILGYMIVGLAGFDVLQILRRVFGFEYMIRYQRLFGRLRWRLWRLICGAQGWDRSIVTMALAMSALIYIPGLLWLGSLYGWDQPILQGFHTVHPW
jgi:biotin transport system substrate-specific component